MASIFVALALPRFDPPRFADHRRTALGNKKRSLQGPRLGPEETQFRNTLEIAAEHKLRMLSGILLRVGMSAAKMSSTLGKLGRANAKGRIGLAPECIDGEEERGTKGGEEDEVTVGEGERTGGSTITDVEEDPLHLGWEEVDPAKVWRHPPGQILLRKRSKYATNSGSPDRSLSSHKCMLMCRCKVASEAKTTPQDAKGQEVRGEAIKGEED
jgi:hypothetical protein